MHLRHRQIEAFRSVMMTGGITSAADVMHVTQPAVSRLIRDLEDTLSMQLFNRRGARLDPTPEALMLYREVERLYLGLDQIAQAAEDIRAHKNIVIRIGTVTSLVRPYLQNAISAVIGQRENVPLVIDVENSRHIWEMVDNAQYDIGFVYRRQRMDDRAVRLHQRNAVVAVRPEDPIATLKTCTPNDLVGRRILIPGRNSPVRIAFDCALSTANVGPSSTVETSMLNCCHFAAQGLGVAIVDQISIRAADAGLVTVPFSPEVPVSYYAIRPPGAPSIPMIDAIIGHVREQLAADPL
ncbi:LysR family transcriptional regulator [Ponticoccus alexandrii]|uniref:LysR family transcriptional regulator n=1 Tax=Ponticoccus alexandrii TaxID=1943633 RepID=A0ABX7FEF8_9RHOB|nr:LysR substrate-binding domain-containing protein [Ponticoccus alexandrii]ETA52248.2 LysR family transcriptional regulator [Rhodobacteraceae bacterium PD-2]QRF68928.1 LysR family transcriptional regulator [Ponticoccus alexandrii]